MLFPAEFPAEAGMQNAERAFAAGKWFPAEAFVSCAEDAEAFSPPMTQSYKTHACPCARIDCLRPESSTPVIEG